MIDYTVEPAYEPDKVLGYQLLKTTNVHPKSKSYVGCDAGYHMTDSDVHDLRKLGFSVCYSKPKYKKKKVYKTKNYKPPHKRIRHSKQMKNCLKKRYKVEHVNSILHRSYKRIDCVAEKYIGTFCAFVQIAMSMIILTDNG